ncbi:MAG: type VI secretion system Vgr family protein [Thermodesulfobacteriota bacterium]
MNLFSQNSANQSQFACRIKGVPDNTFLVKDFQGNEHGLSCDYRFSVSLEANSLIRPADACGRRIVLQLKPGQSAPRIHGVVTGFSFAGQTVNIGDGGAQRYQYSVTFASPLAPLKLSRRNRVFLQKTVPQVIEEVLQGGGLAPADFSLENATASYPAREFVVQYDESDYDFLARLMAHNGLFFSFAQQQDKAQLQIHDQVAGLQPLTGGGELAYVVHSGANRDRETIFAFRPQATLQTGQVEVKDYNYETPGLSPVAVRTNQQEEPRTSGKNYLYGEKVLDMDQAKAMAALRSEELDWQRRVFVAETDCRAASPGRKINMVGHPEKSLNGHYLIIEVEHSGDQAAGQSMAGGEAAMEYRNKLKLIPADAPFRPIRPPSRRSQGLFTARVESSGGAYAHLDDQGRYRLRLDLDQGEAPKSSASHPVRQLQPYGGNNYGLHFPLHSGTEVAVACEGGDLDRPLIMGVLPNPACPSPVTSNNFSEHILRTWGGNELIMDDRQGENMTRLTTKGQQNSLLLTAHHQGHKASLTSEQGEMAIQAKKTITFESGGNQRVEVGADQQVVVENRQQLLTKNKEAEIQAATDIKMAAGENFLSRAENGNGEILAGQGITASCAGSHSLRVQQENLEIMAAGGNVELQAASNITISGQGGGQILISQNGQGGIAISKSGELILDGPSITINAPVINLKGGSPGAN